MTGGTVAAKVCHLCGAKGARRFVGLDDAGVEQHECLRHAATTAEPESTHGYLGRDEMRVAVKRVTGEKTHPWRKRRRGP